MKKIRYGLEKNFNMLARRLHCILDTHPQNPLPCPLPTLYRTALYSMHIVLSARGDSTWHFYRRAQSRSRRGKEKRIYWKYLHEWSWTTAKSRNTRRLQVCLERGKVCVAKGEGLPFWVAEQRDWLVQNAVCFSVSYTNTNAQMINVSPSHSLSVSLSGESHTEQWAGCHQSHQIGTLGWYRDHTARDCHDARLQASKYNCLLWIIFATW